jgi:hypothetical protein
LVAETKRAQKRPVEDPAQEQRVLEAALQATRDAAKRLSLPEPDPDRIRSFYRAQIQIAKAVQHRVLARPADGSAAPDLAGVLRPALSRISDRMAQLLVEVSREPLPKRLEEIASRELHSVPLESGQREMILESVLQLRRAPE